MASLAEINLNEELISRFEPRVKEILGDSATLECRSYLEDFEKPGYSGEYLIWQLSSVIKNHKPIQTVVASFRLTELPGCCGILVSHRTSVNRSLSGKGIAQLFQEMKEFIAKKTKYASMIATVRESSSHSYEKQLHILTKFGWVYLSGMTNPKTGNRVSMWEKKL